MPCRPGARTGKVTYPFTADSGNYKTTTDPAQLKAPSPPRRPWAPPRKPPRWRTSPGGFKAVKAADVFANLDDGDASNDPILLDVRSAEDYALGHVPGRGQCLGQDPIHP